VSGSLADRSRAVGGSVAEVVASLQFHDIVRQQVEHVEEALRDMVELAAERACPRRRPRAGGADGAEGDGQPGESEDCWRDLVGWMADVSELQVSQLGNASQRFGAAVQGLRDGLSGISAQTGDLLADLETITAAGDRGEGTVFARVARSTARVIRAMERSGGQAREIAALIGEVAATVSETSRFVSSIEEVGSEIELIAINASIKAAHTGDRARPWACWPRPSSACRGGRDRTRGVADVLRAVADVSRDWKAARPDTRRSELLASYSEARKNSARLPPWTATCRAHGRLARGCRALGASGALAARWTWTGASARLDEPGGAGRIVAAAAGRARGRRTGRPER
jgi:hypothetical protein